MLEKKTKKQRNFDLSSQTVFKQVALNDQLFLMLLQYIFLKQDQVNAIQHDFYNFVQRIKKHKSTETKFAG